MGRNNRERRAAKKRARRHNEHQRTQRPGASDPPPLDIQQASALAVQTWAVGDEHEARTVVDWMVDRWGGASVGKRFDQMLDRALDSLWEHGWQPVDVVRMATRKLGKAARALVVDAVAANARGYRRAPHPDPAWMDQLSDLGADGAGRTLAEHMARTTTGTELLHRTIALLALLSRLGPLPQFVPPPSQWSSPIRVAAGTGVDPKILDRVRALLAKAESTEFPEEAAAFTAKAQSLITRHALDRALLESGRDDTAEPTARRVGIDSPYVEAKSILLHTIAEANRCRSVLHEDLGMASVFGHPGDLDAVELLFASLLVQATGAVTAMGPQRDVRGRSRTRSFRQSFFYGFADKIGDRLTSAARTVTTEMPEGDERLLPVLAARDKRVDDAVHAAFPKLKRIGSSVSNYQGYVAGRAAGEVASLDVRRHLEDQAS